MKRRERIALWIILFTVSAYLACVLLFTLLELNTKGILPLSW